MRTNRLNIKSLVFTFFYPSVLLTVILFFSVLSIRLYFFYKTGVFEAVLFELFCESVKGGFAAGSVIGTGLVLSICFFSNSSGNKEK